MSFWRQFSTKRIVFLLAENVILILVAVALTAFYLNSGSNSSNHDIKSDLSERIGKENLSEIDYSTKEDTLNVTVDLKGFSTHESAEDYLYTQIAAAVRKEVLTNQQYGSIKNISISCTSNKKELARITGQNDSNDSNKFSSFTVEKAEGADKSQAAIGVVGTDP